jgi:uncharacterized membrane protein
MFLSVSYGGTPKIGDVFNGFNSCLKAFTLQLLITIFTFLWSMLLIVPGIIKGIAYSMSFYILADNPNMTASEALNESKRITRGHKAELFVLSLSFILWYLLMCVTFGLAGIYVLPYVNTTTANFYQ